MEPKEILVFWKTKTAPKMNVLLFIDPLVSESTMMTLNADSFLPTRTGPEVSPFTTNALKICPDHGLE